MAKLVFDIETSALPLDTFDTVQREYLFRDAERLADESERTARRAEIQHLFSLWPLTARVVCIAMLNADTGRGQVLLTAGGHEEAGSVEGGPVQFVVCRDETEMLTAFWDVAKHYDSVITFNGRGFDVPFIYLRSALLNVPISRKDWLGYRYQCEPHCDLADQLTFYGGNRDGAGRRFNLDFYCKAFGIDSPKSHGVTGMDVGHLLAMGCYRQIAEYCLRDVEATVRLYHIWRERLSGIK
jgi:3'-5' exonuclease